MRRGLAVIVAVALLWAGAAPARAQAKPPRLQMQVQPQGQIARPKAHRQIKIKPPPANIVQQVLAANPGAKVLAVKPLAAGGYSVTIRQRNVVKRINVGG